MSDTKQFKKNIARRAFLETSAASLLGYSVLITAPKSGAANQLPSADFSNKIAKLHANGNADTLPQEPLMQCENIKCDILVAGGGLSGISVALSAARRGKRVVLLQDRSRLGGNSSSE